MKRANGHIDGKNPKEWMDYMFDHTVIVSVDDPYLDKFKQMEVDGIIQLRIIPAVGAEQFAKYIYNKVNKFVLEETNSRVKVAQVEFMENNKNSSIYYEDNIKINNTNQTINVNATVSVEQITDTQKKLAQINQSKTL
jgi:6-pyruvoyltetrahydropterin/6-carboxytetrahydropterin synthase